MKRIAFSIITCFFVLFTAQGQAPTAASTVSFNFEQFQKKVTKSDADIQDPKKSLAPKTWFSRGELMQTVYELNGVRKNIAIGLEGFMAKSLFGEPKSIETAELSNGTKQEKYVYEGYELIFNNSKLANWNQTRYLVERPLDKAYEAFAKCQELDKEGKMAKKLLEKYTELAEQYQKEGISEYLKGTQADEAKDVNLSHNFYVSAFKNFKNAVEVNALPIINKQDTIYMYYAGFCANRAKDFSSAIKYLEMARSLKLEDAAMYQLLGETYIETGDTTKGIAVVKDGISTIKENGALVIFLVNFYLKKGESQAALEYLKMAKEQDPSNKTLYFVEGTLYDKLNDFENAKTAYQKAIDMDPAYFEPTFNFAALHYNRAVKMIDDAVLEKDNKVYEQKINAAYKELEKVVPMMEKAAELGPEDKAVLETLKNIYYRLKMTDKMEEIKQRLDKL
jgi:tetratricopeptide (TPR) repeat protein